MSKPTALQYGCYYHIYNRGNNREIIFFEDRNYHYFLQLHSRYIPIVADTHAYCLLHNHFHLLVRIKTISEQKQAWMKSKSRIAFSPRYPSQQFGNLFNAYTKAINIAHKRTGSLFQKPFGRIYIDSDAYFTILIAYIHQNPQKHGFIDDFRDWPYSSYHALISTNPTILQRNDVMAWFNGVKQFEEFHLKEIDSSTIALAFPDEFE